MIIALCDGFRSMTLREMCEKVQVNVCGGSVWLAVPEGTVQLTLDFKISEEFIDMFDWADNNRPMPCMVYLSDVDLNHCFSLIDATADVGRPANSWGKKDRFLYVSNENKKDENYDFVCPNPGRPRWRPRWRPRPSPWSCLGSASPACGASGRAARLCRLVSGSRSRFCGRALTSSASTARKGCCIFGC